MGSSANPFEEINQKLEQIIEEVGSLRRTIEAVAPAGSPSPVPALHRRWYTVDAAATLLDKSQYTVREWCRLGRIHAKPTGVRRGKGEAWSISIEEINRFQNEGLLEIDPARNKLA